MHIIGYVLFIRLTSLLYDAHRLHVCTTYAAHLCDVLVYTYVTVDRAFKEIEQEHGAM